MTDSFQAGYSEDPDSGEVLVGAPEGLSEEDLLLLIEALIQQNPDIGFAKSRFPSQPIPTTRKRSPEQEAMIDALFSVGNP